MSNLSATEVIAHRGASGFAPENSISAIKKGIELQSHYIEIDVHMTKDGVVISHHDNDVDRTSNGEGSVKSLTLKEIQSFDAGSWFDPKFKNEKIPTLKEVLKVDFKNSKLIIEVKNPGNKYPGIEKKIVNLVQASSFKNEIIYKSFSTEVLDAFRKLDPSKRILYVTIGPLLWDTMVIDDFLRTGSLFDVDADFYQVHRMFISKKIVQKAHEKEKKVIAWDVHKPDDIKKMKLLNVDIIETDFPNRVMD